MRPLIISLFDDVEDVEDVNFVIHAIAKQQGYEVGHVLLHDFPDGESYIKFQQDVLGRDLIVFMSLDRPNTKILPLILVAETARALGARRVGLCAPYLAYMRQDKQFKPGEGITSVYFAKLLTQYVDWLVTVDPHLHRYHHLDEIYAIPNIALHATRNIAQWIEQNITKPLLIGPDSESEQWVAEIAHMAHAPYIILDKNRYGDYEVDISTPILGPYDDHTPVLVDDIISTAQTMIVVVQHLQKSGMKKPVCVGIHAVFSGDAYKNLLKAKVSNIVTCNTIQHKSNGIDVSLLLSEGISKFIK
ncbi:MAG: ribose-phosphate pyrophosphokinase [Legionellaceae bacterium]|nr:ribose-phosphate pyrophosphokinase [Legionellaceae bacterium]